MRIIFCLILTIASSFSDNWVNLWPNEAPGAPRPPAGSESAREGLRTTDIEVPQYLLYPAKNPNGQCVVVLPGGGYSYVSMENEGVQIARDLNARGITVMMVKYRVSTKDSFGYQFPVPLLDARRAIRTARAKAKDWKIDESKIGVMGFSAGGHLAACATTMFDQKFPAETSDAIDQLSCRPDFSILGYPVILMGTDKGHRGSQRRLIGEAPTKEELANVKVIDFINAKTPPVYFVHASDDRGVPLHNSLEFAARCAEHQVPVSGQIFATGGHGFGGIGRAAATGWMEGLATWMKAL